MSVFSPSNRTHYLNITPTNVVSIYSPGNSVNGQLKVIKVDLQPFEVHDLIEATEPKQESSANANQITGMTSVATSGAYQQPRSLYNQHSANNHGSNKQQQSYNHLHTRQPPGSNQYKSNTSRSSTMSSSNCASTSGYSTPTSKTPSYNRGYSRHGANQAASTSSSVCNNTVRTGRTFTPQSSSGHNTCATPSDRNVQHNSPQTPDCIQGNCILRIKLWI